jgi:hypothetical protein
VFSERNTFTYNGEDDLLPVLKDRFEAGMEPLYHADYIQYFNGMRQSHPRPDPPTTYADLRSPGYIIAFTEEDAAHITESLSSAGVPLSKRIPDEVTAILNEELSAFLAGHGSAEDCAGKIQSRVSIWLAERR